MMSDDIKVICKKCGRSAKASEYVLDPDYKMMVCSACSKERLSQVKTKKQEPIAKREEERTREAQPMKNKPAGWDSDDEALEKMTRSRPSANGGAPKSQYERIDDENVKLTCPKCEYKFTYNTERMNPNSCPYCGVKLNIKVR
jgi:Zn finger protein HypA/HybF involved in hydrogenase expression